MPIIQDTGHPGHSRGVRDRAAARPGEPKDASKARDLRVHVREKLIEYLQRELPECRPLQRLQMSGSVASKVS